MHHETNDLDKDPYSSVHNMRLLTTFTTRANFSDNVSFGVNSRHHQACNRATKPDELTVLGIHEKKPSGKGGHQSFITDNIVEMFGHNELPIVGIQSHIEDNIEAPTIMFMDNVVQHLIKNKRSILL